MMVFACIFPERMEKWNIFKSCLRGEVENVGESERMGIAGERSQREGGGL